MSVNYDLQQLCEGHGDIFRYCFASVVERMYAPELVGFSLCPQYTSVLWSTVSHVLLEKSERKVGAAPDPNPLREKCSFTNITFSRLYDDGKGRLSF